MIVKDAKEAARRWVIEVGSKTPGFLGAYQPGSTNGLPDDAEFPASSDVDIALVLSHPDYTEKLGKFLYRDVILEVSYVPQDQILAPDQVLGSYHRASGFRTPNRNCIRSNCKSCCIKNVCCLW